MMRDDALVNVLGGVPYSAFGPGRLGREGAAGAMLWRAGAAIWDIDLFNAFFHDEAPGIDWLTGYLCHPDMIALFKLLRLPLQEDDEEPEELFARSSMNTLGSDVVDDY